MRSLYVLGSVLLAIGFVGLASCAQGVTEDLFRPSSNDGGADVEPDPFQDLEPTDDNEGGAAGSSGSDDFGETGGFGGGSAGTGASSGSGGIAGTAGSGGMGGTAGSGGTGGSGGTAGTGGSTGGSGGTAGTGGSVNIPSSWYCDPSYYDEGDAYSCDCGCGAPDPDCGGAGCTTGSCYDYACDFCHDVSGYEITCGGSGGGSGGGTSGWLCDPSYYDAWDGCDCGCGIPDPDCGYGGCETPGCYASGCDFCFDTHGNEVVCMSAGGCTNTCEWAYDGECDDGGPGASYDLCDYGTDCADCGPR